MKEIIKVFRIEKVPFLFVKPRRIQRRLSYVYVFSSTALLSILLKQFVCSIKRGTKKRSLLVMLYCVELPVL